MELDQAIAEFVQADTTTEQTLALQRHPELLMVETQDRLTSMLEASSNQVERERFQSGLNFLEFYHQQLSQFGFPESLHWRIFRAQLFEHAYSSTRDVAFLTEALDGWLGILDSEEFRNADPDFQLNALGSTAAVFLNRFQATKNVDDISAYISLIQRKIAIRPDANNVAMLFNNLGQAFKDRVSVQPSQEDAKASVNAYEQAVAASSPEDPEQSRYWEGLCQARFNHYWSTLDPENVRRAIEAADAASVLRERSFASFLDQMGGLLMHHYDESGHTASADVAIEVFTHISADPRIGNDERAVYLGRLGRAFVERAQTTPNHEGLERAVEVLDAAANTRETKDSELLTILSYRSNALGLLLESRYDSALNERAIANSYRALELAEMLSESKPLYLMRIARCLRLEFDHQGDRARLEQAQTLLAEALSLCPSDSQNRATILGQLGSDLLASYTHFGKIVDLTSGIENLQESMDLAEDNHPNKPDFCNELAVALRSRYLASGRIDDIERSTSNSIEAIRRLPDTDRIRRARFENNVGLALMDRAKHMNRIGDLDEAIISFEYALATISEFGANPHAELSNLGTALARRARVRDCPVDLERAIQCFKNALTRIDQQSPEALGERHNLATALGEHLERQWVPEEFDLAMELIGQAIDLAPDRLPDLPMYYKTLGDLLRTKFAEGGEEADREATATAYKRGAELGLSTNPELAMGSARSWLEWAYERSAWSEVVESYELVKAAATKLVQSQIFRRAKNIWLKEFQSLSAKAAYAFLQLDLPTEAALALEEGQAQLLSETLMLEELDLSSIADTGHEGLYREYQEAMARLQALKQTDSSTDLRRAHDRIQELNQTIRQIPGHEDFLRPDVLANITAAAALRPVAYCASTPQGGLLAVVHVLDCSLTVRTIRLPSFNDSELDRHLYGTDSELGYLTAYDRWIDDPDNRAAAQSWLDRLNDIAVWLWESVMALLLAANLGHRFTLVPIGRAALLPFHAAFEPSSVSTRFAIDELTLAYAPNARSIASRIRLASSMGSDPGALSLVGIVAAENEPVLPNARDEALAVTRHFNTSQIIEENNASASSVLEALVRNQVAHFACHAHSDLADPGKSYLLLGSGEQLTVAELLAMTDFELRLAFLSACETARSGTTLPDEIIGLPSSLLIAGACGVIASSWAVTDVGSLILALYFYDEWSRNRDGVEALRSAQRWMRDSDWKTILDFLESQIGSGTLKRTCFDRIKRGSERAQLSSLPFSHVFHWGVFNYNGV